MAGYATILFYEDEEISNQLVEKFPIYKDQIPIWAQQSNAMLQMNMWLALELEGFGANLQHYNPIIDEKVKQIWNIPDSWKLVAQMPFGTIREMPKEKPKKDPTKRILVFGS